HGRPADLNGRAEEEIKTYDFLDKIGVSYDRLDHEAAYTMEACEAIDRDLGTVMCKNLFLCNRQQTDFYLLLIPGGKKFKTKDLSAQLGVARLSFAGEEFMQELLRIQPGSVSVMGLMNDADKRVRLLIDEDLLKCDTFGCHPCRNTASLKIATEDLMKKVIPALAHEPTVVTLPEAE
ncbi:MAG TPA: prolyl-tRNA synthetase associated domain-containing protein, partial [Ruminococcaceae bacterium]|nr:prolyl-tRNA synthetase associated domain-containing protein [Oscillospiraceae bacterium]